MITYNWNKEKNLFLKESRGISFEQIVIYIEQDSLIDIIEHPNGDRYKNQKILIINIDNYIYTVPFVQNKNERFLKTVIPSRKFTKKYLGDKKW